MWIWAGIASVAVLGVLGILAYVATTFPRYLAARGHRSEVGQEPLRPVVEGLSARLADLEARVNAMPTRFEALQKEAHNAAERARYHAERSKKVASTLLDIDFDEEGEGEGVREGDAGGGDFEGVLPLPTGVEGVPGDAERGEPVRVDPRVIHGMG